MAAVAAASVPALGLVAWWGWLPGLARERAAAAVEQRVGMATSIGGARLGWGGVVFEDLRLQGEHGGVEVRVAEVEVRGSLLELMSRGSAAAEQVQLRGADVEMDLARGAAASLAAVRARLQARASRAAVSDGEREAAAGSRVVELVGARFRLSDASGALVVGDVQGSYAGGVLRLAGSEARVGAPPSDVWVLPAWEFRIVEGHLEHGRLDRPTLEVGARSGATAGRLRAAFEALIREDSGRPEAAESEREAQGPEAYAEAAASEGEAEAAESDAGRPLPGWMRRVADGASLEVHGLSAQRSGSPQGQPLVRALSATMERSGASLHFTGRGELQGGRTRWDLWLEPGTARGRGSFEVQQLPFELLLPALPELPWWHPEDARVDAQLDLRAGATGHIAVHGSARLTGVALSSPRIAPLPLRDLDFGVLGDATWIASDRRLELGDVELRRGPTAIHLTGELGGLGSDYRAAVRATLPPTSCNEAIAAVPRELLADLMGFEWRGRMGAQLELAIDVQDLEATRLRFRVANGCQFLAVPARVDVRRFRQPFVHRVEEPDGTVFEMTTGPGSDNWAPIATLSPFLVHAVVAHEDAGFFRHSGFSVRSIRDALVRNLREGRYVVGASTITMQLAKNLFLHRDKTLARKVQEVILTWWLESALDKEEILELYLNVIEYGPSVYGIVQAAAHYFGCEPADLSPAQSAFLACVLPNPKAYHSSWERGALTSSMRRRVERFLRHLHARGRIDDAALDFGLSELGDFRFARPGEAPLRPPVRGSAAPLPWTLPADEAWDEPGEGAAGAEAFDDDLDESG